MVLSVAGSERCKRHSARVQEAVQDTAGQLSL